MMKKEKKEMKLKEFENEKFIFKEFKKIKK